MEGVTADINQNIRHTVKTVKEKLEEFWDSYYVNTNTFSKDKIKIYDELIPKIIMDKINDFASIALWKYDHEISTNNRQKYIYDNVVYEEIKKFSVDVYNNL